jgi:hypothetical protein
MQWEEITLRPLAEPVSMPEEGRGDFDFGVKLSRVPEMVWTDEFTKFEREQIGYEPHAVARFDKDRILVLTTLKGLSERWSHIQAAARHANQATVLAKQKEIADGEKAKLNAAAFRAALESIVSRLPQ